MYATFILDKYQGHHYNYSDKKSYFYEKRNRKYKILIKRGEGYAPSDGGTHLAVAGGRAV